VFLENPRVAEGSLQLQLLGLSKLLAEASESFIHRSPAVTVLHDDDTRLLAADVP
jgi:hypothetical protein